MFFVVCFDDSSKYSIFQLLVKGGIGSIYSRPPLTRTRIIYGFPHFDKAKGIFIVAFSMPRGFSSRRPLMRLTELALLGDDGGQ